MSLSPQVHATAMSHYQQSQSLKSSLDSIKASSTQVHALQ
jgi:hypothetical protein